MTAYLLTVATAVVGTWAAAVCLIGRLLTRPRPHRTFSAPPTRPTPKRRDDFTLTS